MNVQFIAIDDLRPQFGKAFATPEVKTPNMDSFFLDRGGSAMQLSYVQMAVCGPSRSSMLTSRRPDSTHVGVGVGNWCWCQRSQCDANSSFLTLPLYMRQHGYVTAGVGKLFHPDACGTPNSHARGDDARAWSYEYGYGVEANMSQEQWGSIPGPHSPVFNQTMGVSFLPTPDATYWGAATDEETTDGMLAANAVERLANFSRDGIGKDGGAPFFHSVGFHKPHLPHIVPQKWFDMYPLDGVSLPPNSKVPSGFKEENWHTHRTRGVARELMRLVASAPDAQRASRSLQAQQRKL
jgi:iduronate 2-sulfatase